MTITILNIKMKNLVFFNVKIKKQTNQKPYK